MELTNLQNGTRVSTSKTMQTMQNTDCKHWFIHSQICAAVYMRTKIQPQTHLLRTCIHLN